MTPRLLLLTGPAAGDVAAVLRAATPAADPRQGASCDPWWDEVRDYEQAPRSISDQFCGTRTTTASGIQAAARRVSATDAAIRSLPGGEKWLIGLVLPEPMYQSPPWGHKNAVVASQSYGGGVVRQFFENIPDEKYKPARLAILAPEPPPLLVERVRAWGGEVWWCADDPDADQGICFIGRVAGSPAPAPACPASMTCAGRADTWLEAVRAALGEP